MIFFNRRKDLELGLLGLVGSVKFPFLLYVPPLP